MKRWMIAFSLTVVLALVASVAEAQCSICTKTASQLGEKPAAALNSAIIYLMATPLLIIGFVGWRWWKGQQQEEEV
ncbi:MAG TPA: hypothetical protein PKE63_01370 [Lacibacter sp.]|nr:hypothetical protein [Lacibacter sp.]HMO88422.1 hypothetical protein [Lacibacter sp.]HMP85892.1 hypothetical protein [Lacibacter sp.]